MYKANNPKHNIINPIKNVLKTTNKASGVKNHSSFSKFVKAQNIERNPAKLDTNKPRIPIIFSGNKEKEVMEYMARLINAEML